MARFRGTIRGGKGEASRLGSEKSGLICEIDGWDLGVKVHAYVDDEGNDVFDVYETGGSHGHWGNRKLITKLTGGKGWQADSVGKG